MCLIIIIIIIYILRVTEKIPVVKIIHKEIGDSKFCIVYTTYSFKRFKMNQVKKTVYLFMNLTWLKIVFTLLFFGDGL